LLFAFVVQYNMQKQQVYNFWKEQGTTLVILPEKYKFTKEDAFLLSEIGLPTAKFGDNGIYRPVEKIEMRTIDGETYYILGKTRTIKHLPDDNLLLLHVTTNRIYTLNNILYEIKYIDKPLQVANNSLFDFFLVHMEFTKLEKMVYSEEIIPINSFIYEYEKAIKSIITTDKFAFGAPADDGLFWRGRFNGLKIGVEELYNHFIDIYISDLLRGEEINNLPT